MATNHQRWIEWTEYVSATQSVEREEYLKQVLADKSETADSFASRFLQPPLYSNRFDHGWGTLYTAVYTPVDGRMTLMWPTHTMTQSFADFHETTLRVSYQSGRHDASPDGIPAPAV